MYEELKKVFTLVTTHTCSSLFQCCSNLFQCCSNRSGTVQSYEVLLCTVCSNVPIFFASWEISTILQKILDKSTYGKHWNIGTIQFSLRATIASLFQTQRNRLEQVWNKLAK